MGHFFSSLHSLMIRLIQYNKEVLVFTFILMIFSFSSWKIRLLGREPALALIWDGLTYLNLKLEVHRLFKFLNEVSIWLHFYHLCIWIELNFIESFNRVKNFGVAFTMMAQSHLAVKLNCLCLWYSLTACLKFVRYCDVVLGSLDSYCIHCLHVVFMCIVLGFLESSTVWFYICSCSDTS